MGKEVHSVSIIKEIDVNDENSRIDSLPSERGILFGFDNELSLVISYGLNNPSYDTTVIKLEQIDSYFKHRLIYRCLKLTSEHSFWIKDTGWLKASLLEQGMILLDRNNQEIEILSQYLLPNHTDTVYNIEVDDFHTYHIGEFGVWVHNADCCDLSNLKTINTRHYADKVTQKSVAKEKNTVVNRKAVDISADVQAIRDGKANIINNQFHVNGRIYGHHDGTLYPISGIGFYTLNRAEYKVLGVYNQFGNSQKSKQILSNMGIDKTTQNKVLEIFQELNK